MPPRVLYNETSTAVGDTMDNLTSEQRELLDAILRRSAEVDAEIGSLLKSDIPFLVQAEKIMALACKMQELDSVLDELIGPTSKELELPPPIDYEKVKQSIEYLRNVREPSEVELALGELAARMLAKGSIIPEAIHEWREALERKIDTNRP